MMWGIVGIAYAGLIFFLFGACACAGRADEADELLLRHIQERGDD